MGRSTVIHPAISAEATDVASKASGAGRYQNSKREGGKEDKMNKDIRIMLIDK